jgi:hypothetical protein
LQFSFIGWKMHARISSKRLVFCVRWADFVGNGFTALAPKDAAHSSTHPERIQRHCASAPRAVLTLDFQL